MIKVAAIRHKGAKRLSGSIWTFRKMIMSPLLTGSVLLVISPPQHPDPGGFIEDKEDALTAGGATGHPEGCCTLCLEFLNPCLLLRPGGHSMGMCHGGC